MTLQYCKETNHVRPEPLHPSFSLEPTRTLGKLLLSSLGLGSIYTVVDAIEAAIVFRSSIKTITENQKDSIRLH
jgi:hypothetical protein